MTDPGCSTCGHPFSAHGILGTVGVGACAATVVRIADNGASGTATRCSCRGFRALLRPARRRGD